MPTLRSLIIALFLGMLLLPASLTAQNKFGAKIGSAMYQPLTSNAQDFPNLGFEVGFSSKFLLSEQPRLNLMPEFGYLMGNAKNFQSEVLLCETGQPPIGPVQKNNLLIHNLFGGLYMTYDFDPQELFTLVAGPEAYNTIAITRVLDYQVGPSPDNTNREFCNLDTDQINLQTWHVNLRYGVETRIVDKPAIETKLYFNFIQQVYPFNSILPAGAVLGAKMYFPALFKQG
jgi:hypothetical protein